MGKYKVKGNGKRGRKVNGKREKGDGEDRKRAQRSMGVSAP